MFKQKEKLSTPVYTKNAVRKLFMEHARTISLCGKYDKGIVNRRETKYVNVYTKNVVLKLFMGITRTISLCGK